MAGRTIAIGDIHGCSRALDKLLAAIGPRADDRLVLLGDYIDRGPDSNGVLNTLLGLRDRLELIPLLGNHERMLLDAVGSIDQLFFWLEYGGQETVDSYPGGLRGIPGEHLDFLRSCRLYFETETHAFVHANYQGDRPWPEQPESLLLWTHLHQNLPVPHVSGKIVVVGHTPQISGEILDLGHVVCIDTYCCGGRWLTGLDVESLQVWQANNAGRLRERSLAP